MNTYCPYCMYPMEPGTVCPHCGKSGYQPANHQFPPGILLHDRYVVGRTLGAGGFGITYLGFDTLLGRRVAVKEYFPSVLVYRDTTTSLSVTCYDETKRSQYEKGRERFLQEAKVMATLDKVPEIVRVLDFFAANNTVYIVMELLEGDTLADVLTAQQQIPPQRLFALLKPLLRGVNQMHGAGIIHRDISPDNIMLVQGDKLKLMDFGCARDVEGSTTMTVMLKHGYAPIEQYSGHDQGPWTDIYALCATCYCCLTGQGLPEAMQRLRTDPLVPPSQLQAGIPASVEQALLKGLAVNPEDRWQSVAQLYYALYQETIPELLWFGKKPDPSGVPDRPRPEQAQPTPVPQPRPTPQPRPVPQPKVTPTPQPGPTPQAQSSFLQRAINRIGLGFRNIFSDTPGAAPVAGRAAPNQGSVMAPVKHLLSPATLIPVVFSSKGNAILPARSATFLSFPTLIAQYANTVGLRTDGTVVATGNNQYGQCNVKKWTHIVAADVGECHIVGLRADGTVVAVGDNSEGQCNVSHWTDIVAVVAGANNTFGIRADGTVVATGNNWNERCNVSRWTHIRMVATGAYHTVGLRLDGTVVTTDTTGPNRNVRDWTDVRLVAVGNNFTLGVRADGTVLTTEPAVTTTAYGADVHDWTSVVALATTGADTVGLRTDGTVLAKRGGYPADGYANRYEVSNWSHIVAVSVGLEHIAGLRADGTVVAIGKNNRGQCDVFDWTNIVTIAAGSFHTVGLRADGSVMATRENDDAVGWRRIRVPTRSM